MSQPVQTSPFLKRLTRWLSACVTKWGHRNAAPSLNKQSYSPILSEQDILLLAQEYTQVPQETLLNNHTSYAQIQGIQSSPFLGSGMEYEESRPYEAGDEIRHLNWRLMAKTGKAYTKYFQEERQANSFILVDHRASMRFGTQKRLKATQASRVAGYFAWLAQQNTTPVVGARLTDQLTQTPSQEGRGSYEKLMQLFSHACPPVTPNEPKEASFNDVLHALLPQIKAGAHCIFISDFQDINAQTSELLLTLQQKSLITAILIQDPIEQTLPSIYPMHLQNMHAQPVLTLNTKLQQQAYQNWAQQHNQSIHMHLQNAGISPIVFHTHTELSAFGRTAHINVTTQEASHA